MKIARHGNFFIDVPRDSWYSFFNSPYVGHRSGTAVDVYFSSLPLFPMDSGKVVEIRRVRAPKNLPMEEDYVIAIEISDNICLKVLHVRPCIKEGEKLSLGDPLGEMLISGFFMPWSSKHAHFELRPCKDRIRARGAFPLIPLIKDRVPVSSKNEFLVKEKHEHFYWLVPTHTNGTGMTPIGNPPLEGGIPHYKYGAVFGNVEKIKLFGREFNVEKKHGEIGIFYADFPLRVEGQKIRGIGVYCNQEKIKLLGGYFEEGEKIRIEL